MVFANGKRESEHTHHARVRFCLTGDLVTRVGSARLPIRHASQRASGDKEPPLLERRTQVYCGGVGRAGGFTAEEQGVRSSLLPRPTERPWRRARRRSP